MKINKKATVLVYILVLVNLSLIMWMVVLTNTSMLITNYKISAINRELSTNIVSKWKLAIKISKHLNSDGWWFIDNMWCPWAPTNITMSWDTVKSTIVTTSLEYSSWVFFCSGSYNWDNLEIYFNSSYDDFISAKLWNSSVNLWVLDDKVWDTNFTDTDNTLISFLWTSYQKSDDIDDNFDSDNYSVSSTGNIYYPNNYIDNDSDARRNIYWYISSDSDFYNIFWINSKISKYIDNNINNSDSLSTTPLTSSWYLYLDVDNPYTLKLAKFNKTIYDDTQELLYITWSSNTSFSWWLWYIQDDLTLSGWITWNEYSFDFLNYDYALFLKNTWTWVLFFWLSWEGISWSWMYINPIDDSLDDTIKVLWNDIIMSDMWTYMWKISEFVGDK